MLMDGIMKEVEMGLRRTIVRFSKEGRERRSHGLLNVDVLDIYDKWKGNFRFSKQISVVEK